MGGQHLEALVELDRQFLLPLDRQRGGTEHQHPVDHAAQAQLLGQQTGHDRLPGAGVVGQHEAQACLGQHVAVDREDLVGQAAHAREAHGEVGIVGEGQLDAVALEEVKEIVPGHQRPGRPDGLDDALVELGLGQPGLVERPVLLAHADLHQAVVALEGLQADDAGEVALQAHALADERVSGHGAHGERVAPSNVAQAAAADGGMWPSPSCQARDITERGWLSRGAPGIGVAPGSGPSDPPRLLIGSGEGLGQP